MVEFLLILHFCDKEDESTKENLDKNKAQLGKVLTFAPVIFLNLILDHILIAFININ